MTLDFAKSWSTGQVPKIDPAAVGEILAQVSDLVIVLSQTHEIVGVMASPGFEPKKRLAEFEGSQFTKTLTTESVSKFEARMAQFNDDPQSTPLVQVNHLATGVHAELPIRYTIYGGGQDGTILLLGRDLRPIADMQQQLVNAQITLEREFESHRDHDTRFRVLLSASEEPTLFITLPDGQIRQHNAAAQSLLDAGGLDLSGTNASKFFELPGKANLLDTLTGAAAEKTGVLTRVQGGDQMVTLKPTLFRAGGGRVLLCRAKPTVEREAGPDSLRDNLVDLFEQGVDGMVFTRADGTILTANDAFQDLTNSGSAQALRDRPLSGFLGRGTVDQSVLFENATRGGAMRLYATTITSEFGGEVPVEISAVRLAAGDEAVFALIIRDTSRAEMLRGKASADRELDVQSVVELIGNQSLKEIVAGTTDVVEKLSIETAVALTSNNRVAAAQMLGLSRQSLYVKLRKYGLLKQD